MKNLLLMVTALTFLAIAGGVPARAQVVDAIEVNIPFTFAVKNTTLPAGEYIVKRSGSVSEDVMEISSTDGHERLLFLVGSAQSIRTPDKSELVFDRVGDQYFLSEIFEAGSNVGAEVPKSRAERKLEEEGAITNVRSVTVPARNTTNAGS